MMLVVMAVAALDAAAQLDGLRWMAGEWVRDSGDETVSEIWLAPRDGAMAGAGLTTRPGKPPLIEFMKITAEPQGPTFTAILEHQPPTHFVMKPAADGEAVFENLAHDFPQRVIYRRCGVDLCARIEGLIDGGLKAVDWRYRRAPAP